MKMIHWCIIGIVTTLMAGCQPSPSQLHDGKRQPVQVSQSGQKQVWDRIRNNYQFPKANEATKEVEHPKITKHVKYYIKHEKKLAEISKRATPYLQYVVKELESRQMPSELALLPVIESAYRPSATSEKGAAGIWQFMPGTGRLYGLKQNAWYDARRDIIASTDAALNYLSFLHKEFNEDWHLALAAYNAGEHAVRRAIKKNQALGKPVSFWDLSLPNETKEYVPRLLALAHVIGNPEQHDITLPVIDDKPYFAKMKIQQALHFNKVAAIVGTSVKELKQLNPGHHQSTFHPKSSKEVLIPIERAQSIPNHLLNPL